MASGKFELYKDKAGEFRFRLRAANGEIIGASEGYKAKSGSLNGIESVRENALDDDRFEVFDGVDGKYYFHLKAKNGEIILASQGYESKAGAAKGSDAVRFTAPSADVEQLG